MTRYLPIGYALPVPLDRFQAAREAARDAARDGSARDECLAKTQSFSRVIPDRPGVAFSREDLYYKQYAMSFYAITRKKAGFDALRHYEILAAGAVPYFLGIDEVWSPVERTPRRARGPS